tara:strand:- start:210 stop:341 length:132 start_codon:yes stop_codon:yes gene_type:complete
MRGILGRGSQQLIPTIKTHNYEQATRIKNEVRLPYSDELDERF